MGLEQFSEEDLDLVLGTFLVNDFEIYTKVCYILIVNHNHALYYAS